MYPFLSEEYQDFIGKPLANIPAPGPKGRPDPTLGSYADHFLRPFLMALKAIGVSPEIVMSHEVYSSGKMEGKIDEAISKRSEIREIIESISGRELHEDWFPYNLGVG